MLGAQEDLRGAVPQRDDLVGVRPDGQAEGAGEAEVGELEGVALLLMRGGWVVGGVWGGVGWGGVEEERERKKMKKKNNKKKVSFFFFRRHQKPSSLSTSK